MGARRPGAHRCIAMVLLMVFGTRAAPLPADSPVRGRLVLETATAVRLEVLRDDYDFTGQPALLTDQLPRFDFEYVEDDGYLIPVRRGSIPAAHPLWEYVLEVGRIVRAADGTGPASVSLPFALQERNANCMHNGVMRFTLRADATLSPVSVEIASETCLYFKFNLSASLAGSFHPETVTAAGTVIAAFRAQRSARLPLRPMAALAARYPQLDLAAFAGSARLNPGDTTVYGFVLEGQHYRSECPARGGDYPFCDEISLPSYSLAKTLFAGLGAMRLEKLYPGSLELSIADYVPRCRDEGRWQDVTLSQALNMLSGNYGSATGGDDEAAKATDEQFFLKDSHRDKVAFACGAWPRRAAPGTRWVYHSSDTYLLGTAMNALLRERRGPDADIYRDLVWPLWSDLHLSPALAVVRRSYDASGQPFTGYGMTLQPDDIARLAVALQRDQFVDQLDTGMYRRAMQRLPEPQGTYPVDGMYYYQHGFWGFDAGKLLGCDRAVMVPFMSGYGGINVVMMPNDSVFYSFNDGGKFAFTDVLLQSHRIQSMCPEKKALFTSQ